MPTMSGRECFEHLRTIRDDLKVIFVSGYTQDGNIEKLGNNGSVEFIQKPFRRDAFYKKLEAILAK